MKINFLTDTGNSFNLNQSSFENKIKMKKIQLIEMKKKINTSLKTPHKKIEQQKR